MGAIVKIKKHRYRTCSRILQLRRNLIITTNSKEESGSIKVSNVRTLSHLINLLGWDRIKSDLSKNVVASILTIYVKRN